MKPIVHKDLIRRLECAKHNGSKVAGVILQELHDCGNNDASTILNSKTTNYFDCIRRVSNCGDYQSVDILITCCAKDITNDFFPDKGNPSAPYHRDNRARKSVVNFAKMFNAVNRMYETNELTREDFERFDNMMRCNKRILEEWFESVNLLEEAELEYKKEYWLHSDILDEYFETEDELEAAEKASRGAAEVMRESA